MPPEPDNAETVAPLPLETKAEVVAAIAKRAGLSVRETTQKLRGKSRVACLNLWVTLGKFIGGRANQWEERKLQESGLVAAPENAGPAQQDTDICDTLEELAKRMMLHYQNADKSSKLRITITKLMAELLRR